MNMGERQNMMLFERMVLHFRENAHLMEEINVLDQGCPR